MNALSPTFLNFAAPDDGLLAEARQWEAQLHQVTGVNERRAARQADRLAAQIRHAEGAEKAIVCHNPHLSSLHYHLREWRAAYEHMCRPPMEGACESFRRVVREGVS